MTFRIDSKNPFPRPRYQSEAVVLKPRLVEGAASSYNFLGKEFVKFPGMDSSVMIIDGPEMKSSLEYVGEISLEFCNDRFRDKVAETLKKNGVIDVHVDLEKINFQKQAEACEKRIKRGDYMFTRRYVKNMLDTSLFYGAYGGMLP
jgi:hypothetical protein